jgi:hypothetical protein
MYKPASRLFLLLLFVSFMVSNLQAQNAGKIDLNALQLTEKVDTLLSGITELKKGLLFDQQDMISYGFENEKFEFSGYSPLHLEVLSYKGLLAGYAFKISTFEGQQRVAKYLSATYKGLETDPVDWETTYKYSNRRIVLEMQSVTLEQYKKGMNGYLSIKRADFAKAFDALLKRP